MPVLADNKKTPPARGNKTVAVIAVGITLAAVGIIAGEYRHARETTQTTMPDSAEAALDKATAWAAREPSNPAALRAFGSALLQNHRVNDALKAMQHAVALDPKQPDSHAGLGDVVDAMGQPDTAALEYLRALNLKQDDLPALLGAGRVALAKNLEYTRPAFEKATKVAPDNADAWIGLGQADVKTRQIVFRPEAVVAFDKAVALKTTRTDFYDDYADALIDNDEFDRAEALMREYLKSHDVDAAAHYMLAQALQSYNPTPPRLAEAETEMRRSLDLAPNTESAERMLGNIQLQEGKAADAVATLESVARAYPSNKATYRLLSKAYGRCGKFAQANQAAARAAQLATLEAQITSLEAQRTNRFLDPAYHTQLIDLYKQSGRTQDADQESHILQRLRSNKKSIADFYNSYQAMVTGAFPEMKDSTP